MGIADTTLNSIGTFATTQVDSADSALKTLLNGLDPDPAKMTTAVLFKIQVAMANYTTCCTIMSAIIKEMSDALKSVANKIS